MWVIMTTKCSHLAYWEDDVFGCNKLYPICNKKNFHTYGLMHWWLSLICVSYAQLFEFLGPEGFEMISTLLQKRSDIVDYLLSVPPDSRVSYPPGELCSVLPPEQQGKIQSDVESWQSGPTTLSEWFYCSLHIVRVMKLAQGAFQNAFWPFSA